MKIKTNKIFIIIKNANYIMSQPPTNIPKNTTNQIDIKKDMKDKFLALDSQNQAQILVSLRQIYIKNYSNQINDNDFIINSVKKQIVNEKSQVLLKDTMIGRLIQIRDMIVKYIGLIRIEDYGNNHCWLYIGSFFIKDEVKPDSVIVNITKLFESGNLYIDVVKNIDYGSGKDGSFGFGSTSGDISIVDIISDENIFTDLFNHWNQNFSNYNNILSLASSQEIKL